MSPNTTPNEDLLLRTAHPASRVRRGARHCSSLSDRARAVACFALLASVLLASTSGAAPTHTYLGQFSVPGARSLAVNDTTGNVLAATESAAGEGEIDQYDAGGSPLNFSGLGSNQIAITGGSFLSGVDLAVDNSQGLTQGNIYYVAPFQRKLFGFHPDGTALANFPVDLPEGTWGGVAVAPNGHIWVAELSAGLIHEYAPDGTALSGVVADQYPARLSIDTAGALYVVKETVPNRSGMTVVRHPPDGLGGFGSPTVIGEENDVAVAADPTSVYVSYDVPGDQSVKQYTPAGAFVAYLVPPPNNYRAMSIAVNQANGKIYAFDVRQFVVKIYGPISSVPSVTTEVATGVTDTAGSLHGTVNPNGSTVTKCQFEWGPTNSYGHTTACVESVGSGERDVPVHADLTGLTPGTVYHYRLVATNNSGTTEGSDVTFNVQGPPVVSSLPPFEIARTEAVVGARVNPGFMPTTYHVEYGMSTEYGQSTPESQPLSVADNSYHTVSTRIAGLAPETTYHFRVVAVNAYGTATGENVAFTTFTAPSPVGACANEARREAQSAVNLPDCRAYEMVSPPDKQGNDVNWGAGTAAIDGNRFLFLSKGSFAGQPTSLAAEDTPYLVTRHSTGWETEGIALPNGSISFGHDGYRGFNPDMSKGVIGWEEGTRFGTHDPLAHPGFNIYMRDSETGSFELLNGRTRQISNEDGFVWGSTDFGKLALETRFPLVPGTPCQAENTECAWEWDHGVVRLASVLPDGEPAHGRVGGSGGSTCNTEHAMSDDGSRLFFTTESGQPQLYARENGETTTLISGSERTLPGGVSGGSVYYQSAEAGHGNRVFFTTRNSLVDADTNETLDLYMYDYSKPVGHRLTLISASQNPETESAQVHGNGFSTEECGGVAAVSEDARRVYFAADNQIVVGAPTAPGPKLYLWDDSDGSPQLKYIATLNNNERDRRVWAAPSVDSLGSGIPRQARWSRDGRYLAFLSTASLTGFENEGEQEIYRYDAVSGSLDCLTCLGGAVARHGEVAFEAVKAEWIKQVNHLPQNVSDSGQVFFETSRPLVLSDSNGQSDAYEYDGQLHLLSRGTGGSSSSFIDATPTGSDAFILTRDQLVGWDKDDKLDVYDARVEGGFSEPGSVSAACGGEACLPAAVAPNDATPSSFTFSGAGNAHPVPVTHRCNRSQVRVRGVCRKRKPVHRKKRRKSARHTTRRHG